jgi:hypothetical protein
LVKSKDRNDNCKNGKWRVATRREKAIQFINLVTPYGSKDLKTIRLHMQEIGDKIIGLV